MKRFLHQNSLSLVLFGLFFLTLAGLAASGFAHYNDELNAHNQAAVSFGHFLVSGTFIEAVFENWESEFLQMALFLILSTVARLGTPTGLVWALSGQLARGEPYRDTALVLSRYVAAIGGDENRGDSGWVYKVGNRQGTTSAADPSGPFGSGRIKRRVRVTWFYCVFEAGGCQRTLEARPERWAAIVAAASAGANAPRGTPHSAMTVGMTMPRMVSAAPIGADECLRLGLVNRVVPHELLLDTVRSYAAMLAAKPALSIALTPGRSTPYGSGCATR